jgi:hypothetical protein
MSFLLDLTVQTTSRLGLEPIKNPAGGYFFEGCVPAVVSDIHIAYQNKHEKGEFKDFEVPVLQVEFENLKLKAGDTERYYTHSYKLVGTKQLVKGTTDQYENRSEADILADTNDLWKTIKHFLENLTGSPNYKAVTSIPKEDVIKYFDLPGIASPTDRIKAYEDFFGYLVKFVNGVDKTKSQIVDAEAKPLPMWIKMLPNYDKDPRRANKYYAISRFIGQGIFESLKLDKGVPISPKKIKVKPSESLALIANTSVIANAQSGGGLPPAGAGAIDPAVAALLS